MGNKMKDRALEPVSNQRSYKLQPFPQMEERLGRYTPIGRCIGKLSVLAGKPMERGFNPRGLGDSNMGVSTLSKWEWAPPDQHITRVWRKQWKPVKQDGREDDLLSQRSSSTRMREIGSVRIEYLLEKCDTVIEKIS
jgi:hypothetical protein